MARLGFARRGQAWDGTAGRGEARLVAAMQGKAFGSEQRQFPGRARVGVSLRCKAKRGWAVQGKARFYFERL